MTTVSQRVLIVDDELSVRNQLSVGLLQRGFETEGSENGKNALAQIRAARQRGNPHHYIVLDIRLPDIDGLQLLGEIKASYPDLPVVMISGHGSDYDISRIKEHEHSAYLDKPFEIEDLEAQILRIGPEVPTVPKFEKIVMVQGSAVPAVIKLKGLPFTDIKVEAELMLDRVFPTHIEPDRCSGCRFCESVCPTACLHFDSDRRVMTIKYFSCKGCGHCVAACPSAVPVQAWMTDVSILSAVEGAVCDPQRLEDARTGGFSALDAAPGTAVIRMFSDQEVEPGIVLEALEAGFDGVFLRAGGSPPEAGHRNSVARTARRMMEVLGLSSRRVAVSPNGEVDLGILLGEFVHQLAELGPNPIRLEAIQ